MKNEKKNVLGAIKKKQKVPPDFFLPLKLWKELRRVAIEVRLCAYSPYSSYQVGAAILGRSGSIYKGCNVENASYGATICAERAAVMQMVSAGEKEPLACVVVTKLGAKGVPGSPCGLCRQVLREFASDLPIELVGISGDGKLTLVRLTLQKMLPYSFAPDDLLGTDLAQ